MKLPMYFHYTYEAFGGTHTSSVMMNSTATWAEVRDQVVGGSPWKGGFDLVRREWCAYAWPGGYPMYYLTKDGGVLSPKSANANIDLTLDPNDPQWFIVDCDVNWEDQQMFCDHSGERIPPAYGDENQEDDDEF